MRKMETCNVLCTPEKNFKLISPSFILFSLSLDIFSRFGHLKFYLILVISLRERAYTLLYQFFFCLFFLGLDLIPRICTSTKSALFLLVFRILNRDIRVHLNDKYQNFS